MNKPILFIYRKMKEDDKVSRAKNPKYESMSLEELKANMEKSRQELEVAIHNKNLLEQRKKLVERRERSHRLNSKIVISEPQEKDGTENYRRTPETVTMEIYFEPVFSHKRHKTVDIRL